MNYQSSIETPDYGAGLLNLYGVRRRASECTESRARKAALELGSAGRDRYAVCLPNPPISEQTKNLMDLDEEGRLTRKLGWCQLAAVLQRPMPPLRAVPSRCGYEEPKAPRLVDTFAGLVSSTGARAEGRLYEIPMDARSILADPDRAWRSWSRLRRMRSTGAPQIIGLGSMTGIIGDHGAYLAERQPIAVTTGNSLTVYATLRNLEHYCEANGDRPHKRGDHGSGYPRQHRNGGGRALGTPMSPTGGGSETAFSPGSPLGRTAGARLEADLPKALADASLVVTATSSGNCIEQSWLRPGCLVLDVGVPSDVRQTTPARDDVLILSAGYARVPATMPRNSSSSGFITESCLPAWAKRWS